MPTTETHQAQISTENGDYIASIRGHIFGRVWHSDLGEWTVDLYSPSSPNTIVSTRVVTGLGAEDRAVEHLAAQLLARGY